MLYNINAFTPCGIYAHIIARQQLDHQKSKLKQQIFSLFKHNGYISSLCNHQRVTVKDQQKKNKTGFSIS
jgi:ribosomal protein S8